MITTKGSVSNKGSTTRLSVDELTFINEREASASYTLPSSGLSMTWYGNNLGAVSRINAVKLRLNKSESALGDPFVGIGSLSYTSPCRSYLLSDTLINGLSEYSIVVYAWGEVP